MGCEERINSKNVAEAVWQFASEAGNHLIIAEHPAWSYGLAFFPGMEEEFIVCLYHYAEPEFVQRVYEDDVITEWLPYFIASLFDAGEVSISRDEDNCVVIESDDAYIIVKDALYAEVAEELVAYVQNAQLTKMPFEELFSILTDAAKKMLRR